MWKKIEKAPGRGGAKRSTFAVSKSAATQQIALVIPEGCAIYSAERLDFYHDGGDRLAFRPASGKSGFKMMKTPRAKSKRCSIPSQFSDRFPVGTHSVWVGFENGMHVIYLHQFAREAAE